MTNRKASPVAVDLTKPPRPVSAPATIKHLDKDYDLDGVDVAASGFPEGHALHDFHNQLDGKRIGAVDGKPVVLAKPWSEAGTGVYLVIAVSRGGLNGFEIAMPGTPFVMTLDTTGPHAHRPVLPVTNVGTFLEMPDDLADDPGKQEYVRYWIEGVIQELLVTGPAKLIRRDEFIASEIKIDIGKVTKGLGELLEVIEQQLKGAGL